MRQTVGTTLTSTTYARMLMEEHLGRKLKRNEVAHHSDQNPLNDTLSNLQVMTKEEHMMFHRGGKPHSRETRDRISKALYGRPSPLRGLVRSEEVRERMSQAHRGKDNGRRGTHHSEETKELLRRARLGKCHSTETKERISRSLERTARIKRGVFDYATE